jgi:hypothetical protein
MPAAAGKNADRVARKEAATWRFPVCAACAHHAARWRTAGVFARWFRFGGLGLVLVFTVAVGVAAFFIGGALVFGLAALAGYMGRRAARAQCLAACASPGPPVLHLGSHDHVDFLEFMQIGYAADFMRANLASLPAQPSEAYSLIKPDLERIAAAEVERKAVERERPRT